MEKTSEMRSAPGSRQLNLKKSFKLGEFCKAFPNFENAEQERLHRLFIQDEFESLCLETQAGNILDSVEKHVEEQSLDPLLTEKSNIGAIGQTLSDAKKNEIHFLMDMLENAEEQKCLLSDRLDLLKKQRLDFSISQDVVDKLWMEIRSYRTGNSTDPMIHS